MSFEITLKGTAIVMSTTLRPIAVDTGYHVCPKPSHSFIPTTTGGSVIGSLQKLYEVGKRQFLKLRETGQTSFHYNFP